MVRKLFGLGLRGEIAEEIQRSLYGAGMDPQGVDGIYGRATAKAVAVFQTMRQLAVTGDVDEVTWELLVQKPVPGVDARCLSLTAAIEGHGYSLAIGNFDGAGLTWGIIGFTMKHGEVPKIIRQVHDEHPELIEKAFGEYAAELLNVMQAPRETQMAWATANSLGSHLVEPWKSGFARLGEFPEVKDLQRQFAWRDYYDPACATARHLGVTSELGVALCFDIHVQNGGVKSEAAAIIDRAFSQQPPTRELERREVIANAVADVAKAEWRSDVRKRKLAIARGNGVVHGLNLTLENYGLSEEPAF